MAGSGSAAELAVLRRLPAGSAQTAVVAAVADAGADRPRFLVAVAVCVGGLQTCFFEAEVSSATVDGLS